VIERIDELILEFDNLIPDHWCDLMVEWFHANSELQKDGRVVNNRDEDAVLLDFKLAKQSIVPFQTPMFELMSKICNMSYDELLKVVSNAPTNDIYFRDFTIRIYEKGKGIFKPHVDQHAGGTVTRLFTILIYLNDVHEGGETEFPEHNKKVKPKKGKVLMFPCNFLYLHQGNIPISNDKYIATAFVNFKPPNDWQW